MNELRLALRQLRQNPGFTAVVVLTLALGLGANTTVFGLINELLLRPLQVRAAADLLGVVLINRSGDFADQRIPYPICQEYREQTRCLSDLFAYAEVQSPIELGPSRQVDLVQVVSPNFFHALGAIPVLGRTFVDADEQAAAQTPAAVLSHRAWQEWFGGDLNVIGRTVVLHPAYVPPVTCTVVGVAPAGFSGLEQHPPGLWLTAVMEEHFRRSQGVNFRLAGWLAPGLTTKQAVAELDALAQGIAEKHHGAVLPGYGNEGVFRSDLRTQLRPAARGRWGAFKPQADLRRGTFLAGVVGALILLIACANLSNLLLARAGRRGKEMAIRLALGASRRRLFRQVLVESLVLGLMGGGAGILVGHWTNRLLLAFRPASVPFVVPASVDFRVLGFALLLALAAGLLFGTAPAWQAAHCDFNAALKSVSNTSRRRRHGPQLRDGLVVGQIALSLLLLVGAGLCLRSLYGLQTMNPGFNTLEVLVLPLQLQAASKEAVGSEYAELSHRLEAWPGIRAVSFARSLPLAGGGGSSVPVDRIEGYTPIKDEFLNLEFTTVGPGYFEAMGIPILIRPEAEGPEQQTRVWINESFARRYWPGQAVIGKRMGPFEVHGLVKDCQVKNLTDRPAPHFYLQQARPEAGSLVLILRTDGNLRAASAAVRQEVLRMDKTLDTSRLRSLGQVMNQSLASQRFLLVLLGGCALGALLLAVLGIYGVMSQLVTQRTREIGVRMALGAQRWDVVGLVLRHAAWLVVTGLAVGLAGALGTTRVLGSVLHGVHPTDPLTFVVISWLLACVALAACFLPARRASRIDPMEALRHE